MQNGQRSESRGRFAMSLQDGPGPETALPLLVN